jgi:hypothetical protein
MSLIAERWRMSMRLVMAWLIALSMASGVEAATACLTKDGAAKDGAVVAPSLAGLKHALSIMGSGDAVAWNKLLEQKRATRVPAGMHVFIEERVESYRRIRLEGATNTVWTSADFLDCPKPW